MSNLAIVSGAVAAAIHGVFFVAESLMWGNPRVMKVFGVRRDDVEVLRLPMLNQGFYNVFLAGGMVYGLVADEAAVVGTIGAVMVGAGIVLVASKRSALVGALIQATPPAIVLVALT